MQKAVLSLQKGLKILNVVEQEKSQEEYLLIRDGLIQRFEYCIDFFWKFVKLYLEVAQGAVIETTRPREKLKIKPKIELINYNI